jgi:ribose transport system permease protein
LSVRTGGGLAAVGLAAGIFIITCIAISGFFSGNSIRSLLVLTSILGIASFGQTVVVILGGIDLSIAPVIALSSILVGVLTTHGWSFPVVLLTVTVVASAIGAFNGFASHALGAPALIVTLAVGYVVAGATLIINHGSSGGKVPGWITDSVAVNGSTLGIPLPPIVVVWLVVGLALVFLQSRIAGFKRVRFIGLSPTAARLALVRIRTAWVLVFVASAIAAAAAGVFLAGFSDGADVNVGAPYLFMTIAAVVVGGTSLIGGRGGQGRTMLGAFIISDLSTLLIGVGIDPNLQQALLGTLIIVVVLLRGREADVRTRI